MNKLTLCIAAILVCGSASADEFLHPERSAWGIGTAAQADLDELSVIATKVPEAFTPDVRVRLIVEGFGYRHQVIGLKEVSGSFRIFTAGSLWLWPYTPNGLKQHRDGRDGWPAKLADVKVDRCEIPIEKGMADRIIEVWKRMLLRTTYAENPRYGMDGSDDHFAANLDEGWLAGWVWTPQHGTRTGRLENIAYTMKAYCETKDLNERTKLELETFELLQLLP